MRVCVLVFTQVVRVKDGCGHTYSVPIYSTVELGMVQSFTCTGDAKSATTYKTTKVSDIMALKVRVCMWLHARKARAGSSRTIGLGLGLGLGLGHPGL